MKYLFFLIFSNLILSMMGNLVFSQSKVSDQARITFISKEDDNAKTYLCKLLKGDLASLKYELQRYNSDSGNEVDVLDEQGLRKEYIESIVVGEKGKNADKYNQEAKDDLIGNYEVKDQKSLEKIKEKKQKRAEEIAKRRDRNNFLVYHDTKNRSHNQGLGNYYKVSASKRLRSGKSFKRPAGSVALIITYKIREGNSLKTYVNVVEGYLNPGSNYNLRYHGSGNKRLYYLEYDPVKR